MKKWIKNKTLLGFLIAFVMLMITLKYDLFRHPENHICLTVIVFVLFIISWIPYVFKDY